MHPDEIATLRLNGQFYGEAGLAELREFRIDLNSKDWVVRCRDCRTEIVEYAGGLWADVNGEHACQGLDGDGTLRPHQPGEKPVPLDWCERALIIPDTAQDSVTARIDLPGAAFCLTLRRESDGTITLHLPHPEHASSRKLIEQAPGIYEITE